MVDKTPLYIIFGITQERVMELSQEIGTLQGEALQAGKLDREAVTKIKAACKTEDELLWYLAVSTLQQARLYNMEKEKVYTNTMLKMAEYRGL